MPMLQQLDLSTLSGPELRSLLDSARERGHAAQSYEILQEMARRREDEAQAPKGRFRGRRREPGEPHVITLDLGDPLDRDDPFEVPPPPEDPEAEPPLTLAREPEPAPRAAKPAKAPKPPKPPKPVRVRRGPGSPLGFALGGLAGIVLGVGVGGSVREMLMPPPDVELAEAAQLPPPPPPLPPEPPAPVETAPAPVVEAVSAAPLETAAAPSVETAEMVQDAGAVAETPEPAEAPAAACASEATAADRAICGDADLQKLQKDLREAYAEALAAHEDKATLRQRQLAWRDARSTVEDPERLAGLYEARIRKLKAATAAARAGR